MTGGVAFVASPGGHVDEAYEIADRFTARSDRFFITAETMQTRALLAEERIEWVPEVKSREAAQAARQLGIAHRLLRAERPRLLVSTGSALTVPYMMVARAMRIPVTYVESATRLLAPSLTGKITERLPGVERFYQSSGWERPGWQPHSSVFEGYAAEPAARPEIRTVLVTVGSEKFPFRRAVDAVRDAAKGKRVVWQTGNTPIAGGELLGEVRAWWPADELAARARSVDAIVTHAGVGSILMALRTGKRPVVIPRMGSLGEHVDDHQQELAAILERYGLVLVARPGDDLADLLARASETRIVRRGMNAFGSR